MKFIIARSLAQTCTQERNSRANGGYLSRIARDFCFAKRTHLRAKQLLEIDRLTSGRKAKTSWLLTQG